MIRISKALMLILVASLVAAAPLQAAIVWMTTPPSQVFNSAGNWVGGVLPGTGDSAQICVTADGYFPVIGPGTAITPSINDLWLGPTNLGAGRLDIEAGATQVVNNQIRIGASTSLSTLNIDGGTLKKGMTSASVRIGYVDGTTGVSGKLEMTNGALLDIPMSVIYCGFNQGAIGYWNMTNSTANVGYAFPGPSYLVSDIGSYGGEGHAVLTDSTWNQATGTVRVGNGSTGKGSIDLLGHSKLYIYNQQLIPNVGGGVLYIGDSGKGTVTAKGTSEIRSIQAGINLGNAGGIGYLYLQDSSTATIWNLDIGCTGTTATGTVELSNPSAAATPASISVLNTITVGGGNGGSGTLSIYDSTHVSTNWLNVGTTTAAGFFTMDSRSSATPASMRIGYGSSVSGVGQMNLTKATVLAGVDVTSSYVAMNIHNGGQATMTDSKWYQVTGNFSVGDGGADASTLDMKGASQVNMHINADGTPNYYSSGWVVYIGNQGGSQGTVNLYDTSSINFANRTGDNTGAIGIGESGGTGYLNLYDSATINHVPWISIGHGGGTGTMTLSNPNGAATPASVTVRDYIEMGMAGGTGYLTIKDSTSVQTPEIRLGVSGDGTGILTLDGGILIPTTNNANFINIPKGTGYVYISTSGGTFQVGTDGTGNPLAVNVPVALSHDIAIGGADGGITKTGVGTLFLDGANTYDGDTRINQGTLGGAGSLTSTIVLASGGTLAPGNLITIGSSLTTTMGLNASAGGKIVNAINNSFVANKLETGGSATLTGTHFAPNLVDGDVLAGDYTLVTSGGLTASGLVLDFPVIPNPRKTLALGTTATDVVLSVTGTSYIDTWAGNSGPGQNVWESNGAANWNNGADSKFLNWDSVVFNSSDSQPAVVLNEHVYVPSITVSGVSNYTISGTGNITGVVGGTALTKTDSGSIDFQTNGNVFGTVAIMGGTVTFSGTTTIGNLPTLNATLASSGNITFSNGLSIANVDGGYFAGVYNITGGAVSMNGNDLIVGNMGVTEQQLNQSGGAVTANNVTLGNMSWWELSQSFKSRGAYIQTAGTLTATGSLTVGMDGYGRFEQHGNVTAASVYLGKMAWYYESAPGIPIVPVTEMYGEGVYDLKGGTLTTSLLQIGGTSTYWAGPDERGKGDFTWSGGTIAGSPAVEIGPWGTLTYDLAGTSTLSVASLLLDAPMTASDGSALPGGQLIVKAGTLNIPTVTIINNGVIEVDNGGVLSVAAISGSGTTKVVSGTLTANSITQDTLLIGTHASAVVPEPSTLILLLLAGGGLLFRNRRKG